MKFDRLNSSIALNAHETPSIYMALCMIESLFKDVETASGTKLALAPAGDEQLPTKLIWLGRQLMSIYSENSDNMVRNRERLEKVLDQIREQEKSLAGLTQAASELHEAQERSAALSRRLREAEETEREVRRLEENSSQIRERLKQLEALDPAAVRAELDRLSARERELDARRNELKQAVEKQYDAVSALESDCDELERQSEQYSKRLDRLQGGKRAAEDELAELRAEVEEKEAALSDHSRDKDRLIEERAGLEVQLAQLRQDVEDYEQENMIPLREEYAEKSAQRDGLRAQLDALKRERDEAVLQVARLSQQVTAARQALEDKKQVLEQRQQAAQQCAGETERLQAELDTETNRLAELQERAVDLEQNQLPQLQALIQEQARQNKQLEDSISGLTERREKLALEAERLRRDDEALSAEVAALKETHDALVASSEANDEAVRKLRQNVEELRGRNDQEKETRYRQQLEDEKQRLLSLSRSCEELERQLDASRGNLAQKEQQLSALQAKKSDVDKSLREVSSLVQEIAPLGDSALQRRVKDLQTRQQLLEDSWRKLDEALKMMHEVLNLPEGAFGTNPEGLNETLQHCGRALDKLQKALIGCANAVKTEIANKGDA